MKLLYPFKKFQQWYFSKPSLEKEFEIDQALMIRSFERVSLIISIISILSGVLFWLLYRDIFVLSLTAILSTITFALPVINKKFKYHEIFPNLFMTSNFLLVCLISYKVGGYHGPVFNWIFLMPVVAALTCKKRMIIVWGVVSILFTIFFYWAAKTNLFPTAPFHLNTQSLEGRFRNGIQLIIAMTLMGWSFKTVSDESIKLLKEGRNRYQNLVTIQVPRRVGLAPDAC